MILKIACYDSYYDIPLRGIAVIESKRFAFLSEIDQEADDSRWAVGQPSFMTLFDTSSQLEDDYVFIGARFSDWKTAWKEGKATIEEHPLKNDKTYAETIRRIALFFESAPAVSARISGLFDYIEGGWTFEPDSGAIDPVAQ